MEPRLEGKPKRHLDLTRAADGFVDDSQAARGWRRVKRRTVDWEIVEEEVLRDIVDRDVEARRVGEVENVEAEFERSPFSDLRDFYNREVSSLLPSLTEDVALTGGEIRLVGIASRDRTA